MRRKRPPLAERLKTALQEGIEYARGERELKTTLVPVARDFTPKQIIAIREKRGLSQTRFAHLLSVNVKTLQSWEQGVRKPSKPTMRLLQIFDSPADFQPILMVSESPAKRPYARKHK